MQKICIYCGMKAIHQFKNGNWCCSKNKNSCPEMRKRNGDGNRGKKRSKEFRKMMSELMTGERNHMSGTGGYWKGKKRSKEDIKKFKMSHIITLEQIKERYPFFCLIEDIEMGNKPGFFKVRCKNHKCQNSKEKNGWFETSYNKIRERIRALETPFGMIENNLYCSDGCKNECPLYGVKNDPFSNNKKIYTQEEYQTFREFVLDRDDYICQFCGDSATDVHHERPQKLEPFFALDPDFAWSCCEKCHYEKGHPTGTKCSTGSLSNKICWETKYI